MYELNGMLPDYDLCYRSGSHEDYRNCDPWYGFDDIEDRRLNERKYI